MVSAGTNGRTVIRRRVGAALLAAIAIGAYLPGLRNGFIADDYVFLEYAEKLKSNVWFLFGFPPLNFRTTTFIVFALLKSIFGYRPEFFHAALIVVHLANCFLLWKVVRLLSEDDAVSFMTAVLFAIFHAPQEAVLWASAMGEALLGLCLLSCVLFWIQRRYVLSILCYSLALISKESAPLVLLLLPLVQWERNEKTFPREYFLLAIPTVAFAGVFLWTWSSNSFIRSDIYSYGSNALFVYMRTVNRLLWPWFYILLAAWFIVLRRKPDPSVALKYFLWVTIPLLPYLFLARQTALPSRHVYMASMVIAVGMAYLIVRIPSPGFRSAFLFAFLAFNIGYLWFRKDHQFEERAAPTTELLRLLRTHKPTQILIFDFPYPEPDIPKAVSWFVPGWTRDLVGVNGTGETCTDCVQLRWNPKTQKYMGPWS